MMCSCLGASGCTQERGEKPGCAPALRASVASLPPPARCCSCLQTPPGALPRRAVALGALDESAGADSTWLHHPPGMHGAAPHIRRRTCRQHPCTPLGTTNLPSTQAKLIHVTNCPRASRRQSWYPQTRVAPIAAGGSGPAFKQWGRQQTTQANAPPATAPCDVALPRNPVRQCKRTWVLGRRASAAQPRVMTDLPGRVVGPRPRAVAQHSCAAAATAAALACEHRPAPCLAVRWHLAHWTDISRGDSILEASRARYRGAGSDRCIPTWGSSPRWWPHRCVARQVRQVASTRHGGDWGHGRRQRQRTHGGSEGAVSSEGRRRKRQAGAPPRCRSGGAHAAAHADNKPVVRKGPRPQLC